MVVALVAGLGLAGCGAVNEGSIFDTSFWDKSPLVPKSNEAELGLAELVKGNYLDAEAHFDSALVKDPRNVYALAGKGMIYRNTGQSVRARSMFEAVMAMRPSDEMKMLVWSDATPRRISEIASVNLSMIDSGNVMGSMATGAAGVGKPAIYGGDPARAMPGSLPMEVETGGASPMPLSGGKTMMRQTYVDSPMSASSNMGSNALPGEIGLSEGDKNIVARFQTLRDLLDQGFITPEEYKVRRKVNVGALLPLTSEPGAAGLDRPVPGSSEISGRLRAIGRALEMRAITIEQHAAERKMILDALMPETPLVLSNPGLPPQGLMAAADSVRHLETLKATGLITSDEYSKERAAIEKSLQPEQPKMPVSAAPMEMPKEVATGAAKKSGPQPGIHLASYRSQRDANKGWTQLKKAYRDLIGEMSPEISKVDLGPGKGIYYRLLVGPFDSQGDAQKVCAKLKVKRQFCETTVVGLNG